MNIKPAVKRDILDVLKNSLKAIKENNLPFLREQSFRTVHNSSIYQDEYSISISVVIYSIFKVLEKSRSEGYSKLESVLGSLSDDLKKAIIALEKDEPNKYSASLKHIINTLKKIDKNVGMHIDDVVRSTRVKKASNIHRHGLSVGRATELLGISKWDLMSYSGNTRTYDDKYNISKSVKERLMLARKIFK